MTERMSVAGYARHRGVSRQAVYRALAVGRITRDRDGRIDVQATDAQWEETTDPLRGGRRPAASTGPQAPAAVDLVLGEQPARLAQAAEAAPALAPWIDFIDRTARRASKICQEPGPVEITSQPLELHSLLYDLIANYLIHTGAVDANRIDECDLIMFPLTSSKE